MGALHEKVVEAENQQYATLLEVTQAISANKTPVELFEDLGRRLHSILNFTYLSLILHDAEHNVMRLHTLHAEGLVDCCKVTITSYYASKLVWRQTAKSLSPMTNVPNSAALRNRVLCPRATSFAPNSS